MEKIPQHCIANNLRYLRNYYGYTQEDVADLLHIARVSYTSIELGYRIPRIDLLVRLAQIYNIRIDIFFETDRQIFIREITLSNSKNKQLTELIRIYRDLSPFSQGCLFESAANLLREQKSAED